MCRPWWFRRSTSTLAAIAPGAESETSSLAASCRRPGKPVYLQLYVNRTWKTLATVKLSSSGA